MLLQGKYRLGERIGAGAMAAVFGGTHVVTERPIAVKRLLPDRVTDEKARARFEREARAAGRIRSEHVVEVLDFDRDEQGVPFLVLERLFGETLAERLRRRPSLTAVEAIDITVQALSGVADMHRVGVIHRDIKPSNVFLCGGVGGPRVKLVDFGVAKLTDDVAPHLTNVDEMLGSFSFTAPEQLRSSADAGPAADLWSIGVLLYRMLSEELPFSAGDPGSVIAAILEHPTPRLASVPAQVATLMQPIVDRALQKQPGDRYASAQAMRDELSSVRAAVASVSPAAAAVPSVSRSAPLTREGFGDEDAADDAPTPEPLGRSADRSVQSGVANVALAAPPAALDSPRSAPRRLPWSALGVSMVVLGAVAGWTTTGSLAAPSSGEGEPSAGTTVLVSTDPVAAAVSWSGALAARDGPGGEARIEPRGPGSIEVSAPGYQTRTVELPDGRSTSLLVKLPRIADPTPPPAASVEPPATPPDDDMEVVVEPPQPTPRRGGARPSRPSNSPTKSAGAASNPPSAATTGRPAPSGPAPTGAAPAPIRTAPY